MNLSTLDLNLLHVLAVTLRNRSVRRAADELHLTPSAVSNALRRAREALGDDLLVRDGRGLAPTPRALALQPVLDEALGRVARALEDGAFDPRRTTRTFTVALSDAEQVVSGPALAARFAAELPLARLSILSIDAMIAKGGLSEQVDLAIGPPDPALSSELLCHEAPAFVVRRDHPRVGEAIDVAAFCAEGHVDVHLVLGEAGEGNRATADGLAMFGVQRRIAVVVPGFVAALSVAAATDLIAGVPGSLVDAVGARWGVRRVRLDLPPISEAPPMRLPLHMLWHPRTTHDPGNVALRAIVRAAVARR